ncbi:Fis family transcriptional regulator [Burkholderia pseudomallei]|uniref:response regulator n=1 Tax=Burkholderia pseudomallei TaxID=28450 RepID=UPI000F07AFA6|nr:response regulator [Burkholderia pseudomallei]VCD24775.1 Fis family transcriptional regulator [Burkholderia pseudomallei]
MATILVVDDEMGIRELLSEILSDEGHVVDVAENAQAARDYRLRQAPDLVLLDIWMPDTDGVTLLKEWASQGQLTMPVIMMSGHATIDTAVEAAKPAAGAAVASAAALPTLGDDPAVALAGQTTAAIPFDIPLREARDAFERAYFEYHLARENGSMTRVAEKTGLERTHLYRKLKQLGVELGKKPAEGAA